MAPRQFFRNSPASSLTHISAEAIAARIDIILELHRVGLARLSTGRAHVLGTRDQALAPGSRIRLEHSPSAISAAWANGSRARWLTTIRAFHIRRLHAADLRSRRKRTQRAPISSPRCGCLELFERLASRPTAAPELRGALHPTSVYGLCRGSGMSGQTSGEPRQMLCDFARDCERRGPDPALRHWDRESPRKHGARGVTSVHLAKSDYFAIRLLEGAYGFFSAFHERAINPMTMPVGLGRIGR